MHNFALQEITEIEGKITFFKLLINGKCEYDEFILQCEKDGGLDSEIKTIQARMQQIADLKTIPNEKHKDITPSNDIHKEYEIKTHHLRVYMFHDKKNGRIIISCGKKTSQKNDIKHFRNIKKSYFSTNHVK